MSPKTQDDAKASVEKAVAFYKASGKRIALAEFTNPKGAFVQDELYLYVLNLKGTMLEHGVNEKFVGQVSSLISRILTESSLSKRSSTPPTLKAVDGWITNGTSRWPKSGSRRSRILRRSMT
jgi:hypothetical protein